MQQKQFYTVEDVQEILQCSRSKCYRVMQELNRELKDKGYMTYNGKIAVNYFNQRLGLNIDIEA